MNLRFVDAVSAKIKTTRSDMVEKDILLHQILTDLSKDKFFSKNFLFKGGTCLIKHHLGYLRFSEDIDFTWKYQSRFEGKSIRKIEQIKKKVQTDFDSHVWKKSFEEDNFGKRKVVDLVNSHLEKYEEHLTDKEIEEQQKDGKALVKAIQDAYGRKYKKNIYKVIRKRKYNFSLELIEPRIKKISRRRLESKARLKKC